MTVIQTLTNPAFIIALIGHALLAPTVLVLAHRLLARINQSAEDSLWAIEFNNWTTRHIWLPLIKIITIISFILLAYPVIYGWNETAPGLRELLNSERINVLINVLFVISVLLPLLPIIGEIHAIILPIQSLAASQLLFRWVNSHTINANIDWLPGFNNLISLLVLAWICHWCSKKIGLKLGEVIDDYFNVHGSSELVYQSSLLFLQGPLVLIYTLELGIQLPFAYSGIM